VPVPPVVPVVKTMLVAGNAVGQTATEAAASGGQY
jgi:hypothetical protein